MGMVNERDLLRARVAELEAENAYLRKNQNYDTLTRQALELDARHIPPGVYIVMIDIDHLHELNARHGSQESVNAMLRRAFDFRSDDLLLKANYASGDEVVFVVRANPEGFMGRLRESLGREGITATMVSERLDEGADLLDVCARAIQRVYSLKVQRGEKRL